MTSQSEKTKVLVVDDIPENLFVIEKLLGELDIDVVTAQSGNEALRATLHINFSLILLDIMMPGMNGIEVADMLKQDESTSDIPIIFITAMDKDESYELKAYGKGAVDFIYKPFNKMVLLSKVRALLDLYSMKKNIERAFIKHETTKPKILVVDDNQENILVLKKLLNKLDVDIISTTSGNKALTQTLYNDFAVIFLDVQMPEMDGYEVAELLKSDDKTAGIPIIFITAIDRDNAKEIKGYDKGAVDFIFKPFNEFILLSKARVFLDIYKMRAGLEALVAERTSALIAGNKRLKKEIRIKQIAENDLVKARSYLSSVVNSISSVLIGADKQGTIVKMNREAVKLSQLPLEEAQGKHIHAAFPFFSKTLGKLIEMTAEEHVEKANVPVSIDNHDRFFNFAVYPLIGEDADQVVIRIDDVTEAKQMQEELQQRRHIDSLGQLAGGIAHDFNNMLSAIMGGAELLRIKAGDNPDFVKSISSILTSAERAADLTGKLLSFARKKGNEKSSVDIHRLIKDTVIILQRSIDKRIQIVFEPHAIQNIVEGDDSELSNALLNLGINARDAMPEGGVLKISTTNRVIHNTPEAKTHELQEGKYLEICITDTGTGMTEEVKRKAFEPFFTTKEPGHGTGLGLASVYGTVKAHSGTVKVVSSEGAGSTFTILVPISEKNEIDTPAITTGNDEKIISGVVLLVDDEDIVRKVGTALLTELGMDVITAENGRQALEIVQERHAEISLILLDMIMPELNGPDCFREIKKLMPEANVIICSGYATEEMVSKLRMEGVVGFLQKPFRVTELKSAITRSFTKSL